MLALSLLLARGLGADGAGAYLYAATIAALLVTIARSTLEHPLMRASATADSAPRASEYRAHLTGVAVTLSVTIGVPLTLLALLAAALLTTSDLGVRDGGAALGIMAWSIVPLTLAGALAAVQYGAKRAALGTLLQSLAHPTGVLTVAAALALAGVMTVTGLALTHTLVAIAIALGGLALTRGARPPLALRRLILNAAPIFLGIGVMNQVLEHSGTLMLGLYSSASDVGLYAIARRITFASSLILIAVSSVIGPRFARYHANHDLAALQGAARRGTRALLWLAILITLPLVLLRDPILASFGNEFAEASTVMIILAAAQFVALATGPVAQLLMMTGNERLHWRAVIIAAALNVLLNLALIPTLGGIGAALSATIAITTKNALAYLYVRQRLGFWSGL
jgi:O-antigen/teichoic acid export membrane protein